MYPDTSVILNRQQFIILEMIYDYVAVIQKLVVKMLKMSCYWVSTHFHTSNDISAASLQYIRIEIIK